MGRANEHIAFEAYPFTLGWVSKISFDLPLALCLCSVPRTVLSVDEKLIHARSRLTEIKRTGKNRCPCAIRRVSAAVLSRRFQVIDPERDLSARTHYGEFAPLHGTACPIELPTPFFPAEAPYPYFMIPREVAESRGPFLVVSSSDENEIGSVARVWRYWSYRGICS